MEFVIFIVLILLIFIPKNKGEIQEIKEEIKNIFKKV